MQEKLEKIKISAENDISSAVDMKTLFDVKVKYLGKSGEITELMKGMKNIPKEDRPAFGKIVNDLRNVIETAFSSREEVLKNEERINFLHNKFFMLWDQ